MLSLPVKWMDIVFIYMYPVAIACKVTLLKHVCGPGTVNSAYVEALQAEIIQVSRAAGERLPVHTVFFGGGTPSLFNVAQIGSILATLRENFAFHEPVEITLEANPGTRLAGLPV